MVSRALFNLQSIIAESGAEVEVGQLPAVCGDGVLIGQVFQNIIANAIKFRGKERPRIRIGAQRIDGAWEFRIQDNGIGISPEHYDKIFGIFQRLHTRAEYPGTGIGLAFCRKVIQHHGGRIWVESAPDAGSTFHFTIPEGGPRAEEGTRQRVLSGTH
jgi:light-regulated signal transduction histidine kinase (bacteriophytochrome)